MWLYCTSRVEGDSCSCLPSVLPDWDCLLCERRAWAHHIAACHGRLPVLCPLPIDPVPQCCAPAALYLEHHMTPMTHCLQLDIDDTAEIWPTWHKWRRWQVFSSCGVKRAAAKWKWPGAVWVLRFQNSKADRQSLAGWNEAGQLLGQNLNYLICHRLCTHKTLQRTVCNQALASHQGTWHVPNQETFCGLWQLGKFAK